MAKIYARLDQLIKALEVDVKEGARILANATKEYLYDKTQTNLYERMDEGKYYNRTNQFLESITLSFLSASNTYKIYFDGRKIRPVRGNKGDFNAHADFDFNKSPTNKLIEGLEKGHPIPNHEDRDGAHMISDTKKWLENKINSISKTSGNGNTFAEVVRRYINF